MSTELFLNFLGIKMDSRKVERQSFVMNLVTQIMVKNSL